MHALLILVVAMSPNPDIVAHGDAILALQLDDGAIIHQQEGDRITISPYFGNYATLGLFEAYRLTGDKKYLDGGAAWTDWYLDHMDLHGVVHDYQGTRTDYKSTGTCDATDSYAATFLACANMRRMMTGDFRFVMREHGRLYLVYKAMKATLDVDGLTFAKPGHDTKYTMDNAEVYDGFWHARQLAHVVRNYEWVHDAYYARRKLKQVFEDMRGEDGMYAWAKKGETLVTTADTNEFYPAGLANLFVAAIGPVSQRKAKTTVRSTYEAFPDMGACAPDHLYWWVAAGDRTNQKDIASKALGLLKQKVDSRGLAVDHAHYIRALSTMKCLGRGLKRKKVLMGSTYIDIPRSATK
jgi:hypothetical protein